MKIHPLLTDPRSVLVLYSPLPAAVAWDDYRRAARQALAGAQFVLEGEHVVLKPNATSGERFADPDTGITTHPGFLHGLIDHCQQQASGSRRPRITIAEDPRDTDDNQPRHWKNTGFDRLAQETGARLHCPTTYTCVKKLIPQPQSRYAETPARLNVSRLAVAPNTVLFNVPKLKTHNLAITSLCLKNLMGLVNVFDRHYCAQAWQEMPEEARQERRPKREWFDRSMHARWQEGLARRLADTAQVIQPAFNLIEGIVGREGTGFQRGRNRPLGLVVAGVNMVAVDSVASYLMGFDPQRLIYLQLAAQIGLGVNVIEQLQVYTLREGQLTLCPDVASLRAIPPFQVLSGIMNEDPMLFRSPDLTVVDPIDSSWFSAGAPQKKTTAPL